MHHDVGDRDCDQAHGRAGSGDRTHGDEVTEAVGDAPGGGEAEDQKRGGAYPSDELGVQCRPMDVAEVSSDHERGDGEDARHDADHEIALVGPFHGYASSVTTVCPG